MESTWETRDLPVLEAIVRLYDETGDEVETASIAAATGLDVRDVERALRALGEAVPPYFTLDDVMTLGGRRTSGATRPTGEARRAVGAWPTGDGLVDRIVAALDAAADVEPNEEKRSRLRGAAATLGGVARDIVVDVTSAVVVKSAGLS